jgi:hypothetical protein
MRHATAAHRPAAAPPEHASGGNDNVTVVLERVTNGAVDIGGFDDVTMANDHTGARAALYFRVF